MIKSESMEPLKFPIEIFLAWQPWKEFFLIWLNWKLASSGIDLRKAYDFSRSLASTSWTAHLAQHTSPKLQCENPVAHPQTQFFFERNGQEIVLTVLR